MNIENIIALSEKLRALGFENTSTSILKRICFKPEHLMLSQKVLKGKDQLDFQLFFEKDGNQNSYVLMYYDVILQKEIAITHRTVNGIDTAALEKCMAEMDWKIAFDFDREKQWNAEDKTSWEKEQKVESIIEDITVLENDEEGKAIAAALKLKYWAGIPNQELVNITSPLKTKNEVVQRFYFIEGQEGISVDEAYRFLQNRWMEKQMQNKRKKAAGIVDDEMPNDRKVLLGNSPLISKRVNKAQQIKNEKINY